MRVEERKCVMRRGSQFPVGMRVLAVDDDPTCLKVLETLLRRCQYHVTITNQAITALKLLRANRDMFDLVISDVHMPDMDGFKLLELVGLEMDLPVIMMSVNGETKTVMKGITHGACDYLLKPVRIEELRNIWQHVVRRKFGHRERNNLDMYEECDKPPSMDSEHGLGQITCSSSEQSGRLNKKRKDQNGEEEYEGDENTQENEDPSAQKKPRVVWSVELHRKFVASVNQLGIDKAVPKRILELMNVDKLTRENVASHLQKYRLYLKRLTAVASQQASIVAAFGGRDPSFLRTFEGLQNYQALASSGHLPSFASFHPHELLSRTNAMVSGLRGLAPSKTIRTACTNSAISHPISNSNKFQFMSLPENRHVNLARDLTASLGKDQLQLKWMSEEANNLSSGYSGSGLANTTCGTFQSVTNDPLSSHELLECMRPRASIQSSIRMSPVSSENLQGAIGVSSSFLDSSESQQNAVPLAGFSTNGLPLQSSFNNSHSTTKMEVSFSVVPQRVRGQVGVSSGSMLVSPPNDLIVARDIKCGSDSFGGNKMLLPPDVEENSKFLNFEAADNSRQKMDERNPDHVHDSKLLWSSSPISQLQNDVAIGCMAPSQRLNSSGFNQNIGASVIGQTNLDAATLPLHNNIDTSTSEVDLKPKDAYVLGISKMPGGLSSNGCNFDGLLNSIIKMERDDISFTDGDIGCDLYPLGACI